MGVPPSRRALVLAIVLVAAVACALAFAWMRQIRRSATLEDRAREKAMQIQERAREATQ